MSAPQESIAIVGLGCRFAGGAGTEAFLERCAAGTLPSRDVPPARFDPEALAHELPPGARLPMRAALVDDVPLDWRALRLPPAQVDGLHLGEKLVLQTIVEAIQDAGLCPGAAEPMDRAQVWLASTSFGPDERTDPMRRIRRYRLAAPVREALQRHAPGGVEAALELLDRLVDLASPSIQPDSLFTSASITAGRATHLCNFRGGHLAIDAGTASSLAAVSEAAAALARGECDLAIVCGVAPLVTASALLAFAHRGELCRAEEPAPHGRAPSGTVLGEGAFAVALTRAADAGDRRVYAVIEGIGAAAEPGAAGDDALERCVARAARDAMLAAGVGPGAVHTVSTRAAGLASDAAEAAGLAEAYRSRAAPVAISSCVPAVGHLRCAGGMAALVQAALAVHRGSWPGPPAAGRELAGGLAAAAPLPIAPAQRVAVSDAGPEPLAFHVVLARPGAPASGLRPVPRRRREEGGFAVVGVGLVAADANDPETYWKNVLERSDPVRDLPLSRFDVEGLVGRNAELANAFRTRLAATVSPPPVAAGRYGIAEAELATLDPAVPIALLAAEQALRGAGWEGRAGRRGQAIFGQLSLRAREAAVETRVAFAATLALAQEALRELGLAPSVVRDVLGTARAIFDARGEAHWAEALAASTGYSLTSRVAGAFGLQGVPLTVDAACASSLAAVRLACEALARGEVDLALAGGVAYNLLPEYYVGLGLMGALSPRGALPFHDGADGFVPAEGAAAVALRRLEDARADGDEILAVVRGHGISSDGRALSIYSPSSEGQQLALRRALESAGVEPGSVDLLETHGPATQLGDRTEIASCAAVYGGVARPAPMVLSASKSQVGHTTSAAGMIALVRAVLALRARVLPGSNRRGPLDPELHLERIPAVLGTTPQPWLAPRGHPRRAAVNAFGLAGVNHHVLLEEAPGAGASARGPAAAPPATGLAADRFAIELAPVALPERPPLHSLSGRRAVVLGAAGGPAEGLASSLRARGVDARLTEPPASGTLALEGVSLVVDAIALERGAGLVDLPAAELAARARAHAQRSIAAARAAHPWFETSTPERPLLFAAVTAMGGDLGLSGSAAGNVLGSFQHGLALALKQELPALLVKALDVPAGLPPAELADVLLRELEDGNERVQVSWAGRRFVANLRRAPHPDAAAPVRDVRPGDVFLFSGGGRGVVFECALAVARLGAIAVVTGRTGLPDPGAPHVGLDDEGFAELRRREIVRRRGEPGLTPARFERDMAPLVHERELHRNLARARAEGLALEYETCDVADPDAVRALVARVRARHGAVHFLGHGAMVERSSGIASKTDGDVARTVDAKIAGLLNLLEATGGEPLRSVIAFGSGVARFGNRGQTDYAGANALLAALLPARLGARRGPPVHCVTVGWPAWREVGWAATNHEIAAGLDAMGVTSILPEEGRYWFLSELAHGAEQEVLLAGEQMLHDWPFFGASADGRRPASQIDDRGALLVPGAFPLVGELLERGPGRLAVSRRLDPERDPFLAQHLLDGRPVLPGAFALELLAEAAALVQPGAEVLGVEGFHMDAPVVIVRGPVDVRVEATLAGPGLVEARLLKRLAVAGAPPRVHAAARIRVGARPPAGAAAIPEGEGVVRARSFYRTSRDPVALGPMFCRAQWIELRGAEAAGTIEAPDRAGIVGGTTWPAFQVDPLLLDSAFQLAGSVEGFGEGHVCVPVAVDAVAVGRSPRAGENARGRAVRIRVEPPRAFYDVVVVGQDGAVLLEIHGLELRRVARAEVA